MTMFRLRRLPRHVMRLQAHNVGVPRAVPPERIGSSGVQIRLLRTSTHLLATQTFKMADIGEGIAEVTVTEWFVKEGATVKEMDNVCAVESDKASVELTSPYSGKVLKLYAKASDIVKVGAPLMDVETSESSPITSVAAKPVVAKPVAAESPPAQPTANPTVSGAVQTFKLADIGEGIAEVTVTEWFVKEGDKVKEMDNLCSVESDKASVELTSPFTGTVTKIHAKTSEVVKVGSALVEVHTDAVLQSPVSVPPAQSLPTAPIGMSSVKEFRLSDIGEGIAEVVVTEWFVKEGDLVKEMDNICGVESDKASVELTSPFTGKVKKLHWGSGDTVKVGAVLVEIEVLGAPAPAQEAAVAESGSLTGSVTPVLSRTPVTASIVSLDGKRSPGVLATPIVRAMASQKGVDLKTLVGSGALGRVLKEDVLAATRQVAPEAVERRPDTPVAATSPATTAPVYRPPVRNLDDKVVGITSGIGKGMVKSMTESLKMPYMALGEEIDVTELVALQNALKPIAEKQYGSKVSMTAFFIKAISLALFEFPVINSKFKEGTPPTYTQFGAHNITVAIDSKHGLMVPNIKDVGNLSVLDIQQEVLRLAVAAQSNKLALNDMTGGTITFSNVGTIGTKDPRPIPFDGQAVIGAAGRLMVLPRYNSKMEIVPRKIMNVRWVGDHRHLDGATLARFSNSFKRLVENPGEWTLTLK